MSLEGRRTFVDCSEDQEIFSLVKLNYGGKSTGSFGRRRSLSNFQKLKKANEQDKDQGSQSKEGR